jgi:hypothetical protein
MRCEGGDEDALMTDVMGKWKNTAWHSPKARLTRQILRAKVELAEFELCAEIGRIVPGKSSRRRRRLCVEGAEEDVMRMSQLSAPEGEIVSATGGGLSDSAMLEVLEESMRAGWAEEQGACDYSGNGGQMEWGGSLWSAAGAEDGWNYGGLGFTEAMADADAEWGLPLNLG